MIGNYIALHLCDPLKMFQGLDDRDCDPWQSDPVSERAARSSADASPRQGNTQTKTAHTTNPRRRIAKV